MKKQIFFPSTLFFALIFCGSSTISVSAHPFGGVVQQTVVSDLTNAILIEYNTHFGPEIVFSLHPDTDGNGVLDAAERIKFFTRVRQLLSPNVSCKLGNRILDIQEIDRRLNLEDERNFQKGLNTTFVWLVSLMNVRGASYKLLRITDNNFKADEVNKLSYVVNILGKTGPMTLEDGGRQLVLDLSAKNRASTPAEETPTDAQLSSGSFSVLGGNTHESETNSLISLLGDESWGVKLYLIGFFTAFVLGALHALDPSKAMMAAYLVGIRGRAIEAIQLGAVVTATHLTSVVVLGILALMLSHFTMSENIYPWLGVASGVLIFLTGYFMMARIALNTNGHKVREQSVSGREFIHEPVHDPGHGIVLGSGLHPEGRNGEVESMHSLQDIISLGVAEGIVPSPSAIVILLFAVTANRVVTGILLILTFSLGLATVLILVGILTVTTSSRLERFGSGKSWIRRLPIFTAGIIMVLGFAIGLNSLYQAGILAFNF